MKQIFKWLREEIEANSVTVGGADIIGAHMARVLVNQAEAKWEKDCCEWKREESYPYRHLTSCGVMITHKHKKAKFCCICGKPIKISEVE